MDGDENRGTLGVALPIRIEKGENPEHQSFEPMINTQVTCTEYRRK